MTRLLSLFPILIAVLISCCDSGNDSRAALLRADDIINTDADSALALLRSVDTCALHGRSERTLYVLLMTRALVKIGAQQISDSVLAPKVAYYTFSDNPLCYAIALSNEASDMTVTLINYYDYLISLEHRRLAESRKVVCISGAIFVLILILVITVFILYRRRKERYYESVVTHTRELQKRYDALTMDMDAILRVHMRARFAFFDRLCNTIYEDSDITRGRRRIYAQVMEMVAQLSNDCDEFKKLISLLDSHSDNIVSDFLHDFPSLPDKDFRLFVFSALGFSNNSIALLMHESEVSKIYARRRHLKARIKKSGTENACRYLTVIGKRHSYDSM